MVKSLTVSGITPEKPDNWEEIVSKDVKHVTSMLESEDVIHHFNRLHQSDWKRLLKITQETDWYPFELTSNLSRISVPILLIVGEGNHSETKGAVIYPKNNPNIHVAVVPFAAHNVHLEQPEIYNKIVELFLSEI